MEGDEAQIDPERKAEFHTLWQDVTAAAGHVAVWVLMWVLSWPLVAVAFWWKGRMDAAFEGVFIVGYVWLFALVLVAWLISLAIEVLRAVPVWAWLVILPLFGIWRHLAVVNRRAEEARNKNQP